MAYSGTIRNLLISCPGDVPLDDLAVVQRAINRWNGIYGPRFGAAVIPISWGVHAAAQFGQAPQTLINEQLVDDADLCIALFAGRLGTATETAESGTAEEIQRLSAAGKYVGILRSRRPVDPATTDVEQMSRLVKYLSEIGQRALILDYATDADLGAHVDAILMNAISRDQVHREVQLAEAPPSRVAEVWPRVESKESVRTDTRGRVSTRTHWFLTLSNTGQAAARDVRFDLQPEKDAEEGYTWQVHTGAAEGEDFSIEVLAPGSDLRFPIFVSMGTASQVRCVVSWTDDRGPQQIVATLRLS